jgi:hypothetical protein
MADGSVEIRITGSLDPSVTSSANAAKAAIGGLGDATSATAAKTAVSAKAMATALDAVGGNWKKITPEIQAMAVAGKTAAEIQEAMTVAETVNTAATEANTVATINSRAAYESLVLVHEALQGRFSRMAGSSMILTQQLVGQTAVTKAVQFATSAMGISIIGTVAAVGLLTAATISAENEEKKLTETSLGLGAQSGLTADQLKRIGDSADFASQSISETTKAAEAFSAAGLHNEETVKQLSNSVEAYSQLVGVKFAEAQKSLASAMQDPIRGAKELHEQLGILDGDQLEQIQTLSALGDKDQAVAIITEALKQRIDEAHQAGVGVRGEFGQLIDVLSNTYHWIGQVTEGFGREAETLLETLIPALHAAGQAHRDAAAAAAQQAQNEAQLNNISAKGAAAFNETPEGRSIKERTELIGNLNASIDALKVDTATHGANSEAVKRDRIAIEDYRHAVSSYLTEAQKKVKVDQLDAQIAGARHSHNRQLVADLTEQKALIQEAGKVESQADARALASGAGDVAGARTFAPKGRGAHGPSIVSEWEEQLHASEILSNNFFKDQTADELAFWQDKVALTKTGSKEWLAVQSKIYEASKKLAHDTYDEHLADLDAQLEADRDNWAKEKKDWDTKLQYIADHFTKESKEYKDAYRQFLAAEHQHQQDMLQAERDGDQKELQTLKSHFQAELQIRAEAARAAESIIRDKAGGQPLGEINAAIKVARLHQQLAQQEIRDAQAVYQAEDALRQKDIQRAQQTYTKESKQYKDAVATKKAADQQYYDQKRQMEARSYQQQIQDIIALKQAYHSYIDGVVSSTVSAGLNVLDGTETMHDAVIDIYNSLKSTVSQILSQIISNWIVNLLVGKAAQQETAISNVLSYAGVAGAAGVASWAGAPWPIDTAAPAFGASMAAAAASYTTLAGLATGTDYLPRDRVAQLHEGERVLPKADNRKLIQMLSMAQPASVGAGRGGDLHFHSAPTFNGNQASMWQHMVDNHERDMRRWFKRQMKDMGLLPKAA